MAMAKKKEVPELSELQKDQRRRAAAAPHDELCACMQCFYRARKVAREGGDATFLSLVDWRAAQELLPGPRPTTRWTRSTCRPSPAPALCPLRASASSSRAGTRRARTRNRWTR